MQICLPLDRIRAHPQLLQICMRLHWRAIVAVFYRKSIGDRLFDLNIALKGQTWIARGSSRKTIICNRLMAPQPHITSTMPFDLIHSEPHLSQIVDHRRIRLIRVHLLHIDRLVAPVPWNPLIGHFHYFCSDDNSRENLKSKMQPQTVFRLVFLIISNRAASRIATHRKKKRKQ